jgi:hypothetical protein
MNKHLIRILLSLYKHQEMDKTIEIERKNEEENKVVLTGDSHIKGLSASSNKM